MKTLKLSNEAYAKVQKLLKQGGNSALVEAVEKELSSLPQVSAKGLPVVDLQPADNGKYHTQRDWIEIFNREGKQMISSSDVYRLGQSASDELLKSLRADFNSWFVTSTRLSYNPSDLKARLTHNYGSSVVKPAETQLVVPVYRGETLVKALDTKEGVAYLQALFGTKDKPKTIAQTLEHLSEKKSSDTALWTPTQDGRKAYSERAVRFYYNDGRFHVVGNLYDLNNGHSRGVSVSKGLRSRHAK